LNVDKGEAPFWEQEPTGGEPLDGAVPMPTPPTHTPPTPVPTLTNGTTSASNILTQPARRIIPKVLGMPTTEAVELLSGVGFPTEVVELDREGLTRAGVNVSAKPLNIVLAQQPAAGTLHTVGEQVIVRELRPLAKKKGKPASTEQSAVSRSHSNILIIAAGVAILGLIVVGMLMRGSSTGSPQPSNSTDPSASAAPTRTSAPPQTATVTVPDLIGLTPEDADATSLGSGLILGQQLPVYFENREGIVAQQPEGGTMADKGSIVNTVYAVNDTNNVQVPNLVGMREKKAVATVSKKISLAPSQRVDNDAPAGTIVQQLPKAGSYVPLEGGTMILFVSNGKIKVPNVVGMLEKEAATVLVAENIQVRVFQINDPTQVVGTVISQTPVSDSYTSAKEGVAITVAAGGSSSESPNVVGESIPPVP